MSSEMHMEYFAFSSPKLFSFRLKLHMTADLDGNDFYCELWSTDVIHIMPFVSNAHPYASARFFLYNTITAADSVSMTSC